MFYYYVYLLLIVRKNNHNKKNNNKKFAPMFSDFKVVSHIKTSRRQYSYCDLQAGVNDLTPLGRSAQNVVRDLDSLAAHLRAQHAVKSIYVAQVV